MNPIGMFQGERLMPYSYDELVASSERHPTLEAKKTSKLSVGFMVTFCPTSGDPTDPLMTWSRVEDPMVLGIVRGPTVQPPGWRVSILIDNWRINAQPVAPLNLDPALNIYRVENLCPWIQVPGTLPPQYDVWIPTMIWLPNDDAVSVLFRRGAHSGSRQ